MRHVNVKMCGLQEEEHVRVAAEAGADYVGFVFAPGRRQVTPARAVRLVESLVDLPVRPALVGVFVNESHERVNTILETCGLDFVQLSGDEDGGYCARMVRPVMKCIKVFPGTTVPDVIRQIDSFRRSCSDQEVSFLLDTGHAAAHGGTGMTFDWRTACDVGSLTPVMVAGGLDCGNVGALVRCARPYGVDVSSGVELDGRKEPSLIRAFVQAVRQAEQEIEHENGN